MKKIKYLVVIALILMLMFSLSSTSYAAGKTLQITCEENGKYTFSPATDNAGNDGTMKKPVIISLDYNTVEINYAPYGKVNFPFNFKIKAANGQNIGMYMINHNYEEKKVTFNLLSTRTSVNASPYMVCPGSRKIGASYLQGGAQLNNEYERTKYQAPTYKIVSYEILSGWTEWLTHRNDALVTTLGNTYIETDSAASALAPYPAAYVFAASGAGVAKNDIYIISEVQDEMPILTMAIYDDYKFVSNEPKTYKMHSPKTVDGNANYNLDGTGEVNIIYSFYGATSESLDANEVTGVEKILSKILLSIGDVFMKVVQAIGGENINIDAFVFNEYEDTVIDFFNGARGTYNSVFVNVINGWFGAFRTWSLIILMIILVAIGIKSMLYAGTGNQKKIYNMIVGWILAIACMYFGPFAMKYGIELNDVFVKMIRAESKYSLYSVYNFEFKDAHQLGEDSETDVISKLELLKQETSDEAEAIKEELETLENEIREIKAFKSLFEGELSFGEVMIQLLGNLYWDGVKVQDNEQLSLLVDEKMKVDRRFYQNENAFSGLEYRWQTYTAPLTNAQIEAVREYAQKRDELLEKQELLEDIEAALTTAKTTHDLMGEIRTRAGETFRFVYIMVWYILIYQLVLLMILYYKRLITVAVLITIFPLVVMVYGFEKFMGIDKPQSMKTWIIEYCVNVFIQSIHALIYLMLVETGIALYEADQDNWLLFLFAVTALTSVESIIKGLLGMKSSTVSNLKDSAKKGVAYGAAAVAIAKAGGKLGDIDKKHAANEEKIQKKQEAKDKKTELQRKRRDNQIRRDAGRGANMTDSRSRMEQMRQWDKQQDEKKSIKRAKAAKTRETMRKVKKGTQVARNINAKFSAITTGLAGGGDAEDFMAGAAVAGLMAGNSRIVPKGSKQDAGAQKSGSRYAGVKVDNGGRAAQTARDAATNAGNTTGNGATPGSGTPTDTNVNPAAGATPEPTPEATTPQVKPRIADAIRNQIAASRDPDVSSNSQYNVIDYDNGLDD